jgi:hypothetical protein
MKIEKGDIVETPSGKVGTVIDNEVYYPTLIFGPKCRVKLDNSQT